MKAIALLSTVLSIVLILPIFAAFLGGVAGWLVGLVFGGAIFDVLAAFGVDPSNITMWQLGAALAFIGSFFKGVVEK